MNRCTILSYENTTSTIISGFISHLLKNKFEVNVVHFLDLVVPSNDLKGDLAIFVFPILSDERIPEIVRRRLESMQFHVHRYSIVISGDFSRRSPKVCSGIVSRIKEILGDKNNAENLFLDVPCNKEDIFTQVRHFARVLTTHFPFTELEKDYLAFQNAILSEIEASLSTKLNCVFNSKGQCTSLSFLNSRPYPDSVISTVSPTIVRSVFANVCKLQYLTRLDLSFSNLTQIEFSVPGSIVSLILRGNPLEDFSFLTELKNIEYLNITACNLDFIPCEIASLSRLHTLILQKNEIVSPSSSFLLPSTLKFISFYRNKLTSLEFLSNIDTVEAVDVGANPGVELSSYTTGVSNLQYLGLRLLGLTSIPQLLLKLDNLKYINVAKNPMLLLNEIKAQNQGKFFLNYNPKKFLGWNKYVF